MGSLLQMKERFNKSHNTTILHVYVRRTLNPVILTQIKQLMKCMFEKVKVKRRVNSKDWWWWNLLLLYYYFIIWQRESRLRRRRCFLLATRIASRADEVYISIP